MMKIGEPVPKSMILNSLSQVDEAINTVACQLLCARHIRWEGRWRYRENKEELIRIIELGLSRSRIHQVLLSRVYWDGKRSNSK